MLLAAALMFEHDRQLAGKSTSATSPNDYARSPVPERWLVTNSSRARGWETQPHIRAAELQKNLSPHQWARTSGCCFQIHWPHTGHRNHRRRGPRESSTPSRTCPNLDLYVRIHE